MEQRKFEMKKLIISFIVGLSLVGCASQAKYDAWAKVESSKNTAKASQAEALAKVATTSTDKTLAAFAVFTMAQMKDSTNSPMPEDDGLAYLRILAPIAGNLVGKGIDAQLSFKLAKEESYKYGKTVDALSQMPKTIDPLIVNPVIIEIPSE